ncbi:ABC transporter ATP-binding protein [Streptomyces sp. NBC_01614]
MARRTSCVTMLRWFRRIWVRGSAAVVLEIRNLTVDYGAVRALDQVTLSAREGTVTAVLGANGAGKTTLLRTISGLVKPTAGSIVFVGREISGRPAEDIARLGLGHVPEGQGVILELTVEENLRLGGLIAPGGSRERRATADRVYALFPALVECRDRLASTLSGGERRMLVIGRALMGGPRALVLDEPSLGLAPLVVAQLLASVRQLRDESGYTVVLAEQNARSALAIADRSVVLDLGRVVLDADAATLAADEQLMDRLRRAYLGF